MADEEVYPFLVNSKFTVADESEVAKLKNAVQLMAKEQIQSGHTKVVSFHLHQPDPEKPCNVVLLELYETVEAYAGAREDSALHEALYFAGLSTTKDNFDRRTIVLGEDLSDAHQHFSMTPRPLCANTDAGYVLHPTPAFRPASPADSALLLEFSLSPVQAKEARFSELLNQMATAYKTDPEKGVLSLTLVDGAFSAVYVPPRPKPSLKPKVERKFEDEQNCMRIVLLFASVQQAVKAVQADLSAWQEMIQGCEDKPTVVVCGFDAAKSAPVITVLKEVPGLTVQSVSTSAGYLVHPFLIGKSEGKVDSPFIMKTGGRGEPNLLQLNTKIVDGPAPDSPPAGDTEDSVLRIPIEGLLKNMLGRQATSALGIQAELLFSRLGRLRGLYGLITATNAIHAKLRSTPDSKISDGEAHNVATCIANLNALGYALTRKNAIIDAQWLKQLIEILEDVYQCEAARQSIETYKQVEYLQLFEYYRVGDVVKAPAPSLGSTPVLYRVCDAYYESVRSLMGPRKLSFHMGLEYIATLGDCFGFVAFDVIIGDWEQAQALDKLPYVRVEPESEEMQAMIARGNRVLDLGLQPTYRCYRGACFFAHGARKGADVSDNGRMVIDTARGLLLGHLIARGKDEDCMAYQLVVKAYKAVQRARSDGMTLEKMDDQLKKQGLRLMQTVPSGLGYMVWPAVVGFSLGLKSWGHVVVEGLETVVKNPDPWTKLVLPTAKKELLLSLVEANFDSSAPKLGDIVNTKGSGSLFLLHGVPGTGKTLTVMALAEKFAVPAYYLTFGELGTSVKELEDKMDGVLTMCSAWGALVLLDEGDALVERREKGALLLNSMVGVLLKALDAFEGLLFITTNRVAAFDPAALSRVTLAIRYSTLKSAGRQKVWSNCLLRANCKPEDFDLVALAKRGGSGRDINSATRLALNLAYHRKKPITQDLLCEVLDVTHDFRKDFAGGLTAHAEAGRVSDDDEDEAPKEESKEAP
eukprot:gb/GEZN01001236.1/.p1 GENE.gb/GEZN01001236.1/~~gb/GEZN01001236.1/.p1  ORF type:complete len:989 (-),score=167.77 gb/GEZN01001236.1/:238-3177(-)